MEDKHVVLQHVRGRFAGLWQILGTVSLPPEVAAKGLPEWIGSVDLIDHAGEVGLIAVRRSYVLYREPISDPGSNMRGDGSFKGNQR